MPQSVPESPLHEILVDDYKEQTAASQKRFVYISILAIFLAFLDVDPSSNVFGFKFENLDETKLVIVFVAASGLAGLHYFLRVIEEHSIFYNFSNSLKLLADQSGIQYKRLSENVERFKVTAEAFHESPFDIDYLRKTLVQYQGIKGYSKQEIDDTLEHITDAIVHSVEVDSRLKAAEKRSGFDSSIPLLLKHKYNGLRKRLEGVQLDFENQIEETKTRQGYVLTRLISRVDGIERLDETLKEIFDSVEALKLDLHSKTFSSSSRRRIANRRRIRVFIFDWFFPLVLFCIVLVGLVYEIKMGHGINEMIAEKQLEVTALEVSK